MSTFDQFEGFLNVESVGVDGESVPAGGDACERKGNALFFEQFLLADEQARKCAGDVAKTNECEFVSRRSNLLIMQGIASGKNKCALAMTWSFRSVDMETRGGHAGRVEILWRRAISRRGVGGR